MTQPDSAAAWRLEIGSDAASEDVVTTQLVAYNQQRSAAVRERFRPENLKSRPVAAYALEPDGQVVGGCVGRTEDIWQWLTIDTMWVREDLRGRGLGRELLDAVEAEARSRGCRWSRLNTFDFQAPEFYRRRGYVEYAREDDYPPGHVNHLMRKTL